MTLETRADNEDRLRPWPQELTVENVAAWIMANAVNPIDAKPILAEMVHRQVLPVARQVKSLKENMYV
jgi:hypothetical protein